MLPRADFMCPTKACQQDGAATVYEDLEIAKTRFCPGCGSKRITRLYNHVNVGRGATPQHERLAPIGGDLKTAQGVDRLVQPVADEHDRIRSSARDAEKAGVVSFMQPVGGIGIGQRGGSKPLEGRHPIYTTDTGAAITPGIVRDRMGQRTHVAAVDRDSKMPT